MEKNDLSALNSRIARCDLPAVLERADAQAAVDNFPALTDHERSRTYGDMRWLTVKVKAAADEHRIRFPIDPEMQDLYAGFQKDREIFFMSKVGQFFALWARNLGLRKSFYKKIT